MTVEEGNKTIAEYHGWVNQGPKGNWPCDGLKDRFILEIPSFIPGVIFGAHHLDNMKYHKDWNWIIPVLNKLERDQKLTDFYDVIQFEIFVNGNITKVWELIIQAIKTN